MTSLNGKVAVITGASKGLGKEMALALGGAGALALELAEENITVNAISPCSDQASIEHILYIGDVRRICP